MAFVLKDRVGEQITAEGSGALTLSGTAMRAHQTFANALSEGDTTLVGAKDDSGTWQTFLATYTAGTLQRTVVLDGSSGPGVAVEFTGNATVWIAKTASRDSKVINVRDFGAKGDGTTDDTAAINAALDAVPAAGGAVYIPPGIYLFSAPLPAKSNTTILGTGTLKAAPVDEWTLNDQYWAITNVNNDAASITDHDITVQGVTVDYTDFPSAPVGTRRGTYFRMARRVRVLGVTVLGSTSSMAFRGCDEVQVVNPRCIGFSNCGPDFWEQCNHVELSGGYLETAETNQMVNFNPEDDGTSTGFACRGFVMRGVEMNFTGAGVTAVQLEPLYSTGSTVRDVTVIGCIFRRTRLALRCDTANVTVSGNTFDTPGTGEVIFSYPYLGGSPSGIAITGNTINNPETSSANGGVIRIETDKATVSGNVILGTGYTGQPIYRNTYKPSIFGNYVENGPYVGTLQGGYRILNGSDNYMALEDSGGNTGFRAYLQSDNTLVLATTDSTGALRTFMSLAARSNSSNISWPLRHVFNDIIRLSPQTGITAAGTVSGDATLLTRNFCEVTTVASGTGVRLPQPGAQSITGTRVVVWNAGANTLNVYPMSGGQIDALGTDTADTIAAGSNKTYVALSATLYRIEA